MGTELTVPMAVHSGEETQVRQGAGFPQKETGLTASWWQTMPDLRTFILNFLEQKVLVGKQSTGGEAGCDSRAHIWLDRVSVRKVPSPL